MTLTKATYSMIDGAPFNVFDYGAVGDGATLTDGTAIQAAMTAAGAAGGGIVLVPPGVYLSTIKLEIPDAVELKGSGYSCTYIKAAPTFNQTSLLTNIRHDGTQQYASVSDISLGGNKTNGAVCSIAVLHMCSLFVDSGIRRVLVDEGSANGIKVESANGLGPFIVQDVWCVRNGASNFFYEATGTGNAANGLYIYNLTAEHQPSGQTCVRFKDTTGAGISIGFFIKGLHIEQANTGTGTKCVVIDGISGFNLQDIQLLASSPVDHVGVEITSNINNGRIQITEISNENLIQKSLNDLQNNVVSDNNVPFYATPDVGLFAQKQQALTYSASITPDLIKGNFCGISVTDANPFTINAPINAAHIQDLYFEITNLSGGAMGTITWNFTAFPYVSWTNPANGFRKFVHFHRKSATAFAQVAPVTPDM